MTDDHRFILSIDVNGDPQKRVFSGERIPTPNSNSLLQRFAPVVVSILVVLCIVGVPFSSSLVCSEDLLLAEGNGMANSFLLFCLL